MEVVKAAEQEELQDIAISDVNTTNREAWQAGKPVEELLNMAACRVDYHRWCTGEITSRDLVDKWGGEVLRIFQAWYMQGRTKEDVEGGQEERVSQANQPACTIPDEDSTVPFDVMATTLPNEMTLERDLPDPEDEMSIRRQRHEAVVARNHRRRRDGVQRIATDD